MENGLEILDQDKPIEPSVGSPWEFGMRWGWRLSLLILVWFLFLGNFVNSLDLPEWLMPMALVVVLVIIGYKYEQNQKPLEINFKQMCMAIMAVALCSTFIFTSITLLAVMYLNRFNFFSASEGYAFNSSYFVFGFLIPQIGTYIHYFGYAILFGGAASLFAGILRYKDTKAENQE